MAKDKKKKAKKPSKLSAGKSSKSKELKGSQSSAADDAAEALGPLVTPQAIASLGELPAKINPISRAVNAIKYATYEAASAESAPRALQLVGRDILDATPLGYEEYWDPPLGARQLYIIMMDEESLAYVRSLYSGPFAILGPNVTDALKIIAEKLVGHAPTTQAP